MVEHVDRLMPQQLDKVRYVATVNCFFLLTNAVKLVPYTLLGQFSRDNLLTSLALAPLVWWVASLIGT